MATAQAVTSITKFGGFQTILVTSGFFRATALKSGRDLLDGHHLHEVQECQEGDQTYIRAACVPEMSVRQPAYKIEFQVDKNRQVSDARCSCVAGVTAKCKHSAALYLFVNEERSTSQTDEEQRWKMPSRKKQSLYPKGETIEQLFDLKPVEGPTFKQATDKMQGLAEEMAQFGLTDRSLYKSLVAANEEDELDQENELAAYKAPEEVRCLLNTQLLIPCSSLQPSLSQKDFFEKMVACTTEKSVRIFEETIGQDKNKQWFIHKKYRISASRAHRISRAKPSNQLKYFVALQGDHPNLRYGREMEPIAREKYMELTGNTVLLSGLFVKNCQPWICASPDGIVKSADEVFLLEIKSPSSCKGKEIKVPYLENYTLKKNHEYFTQVQIQMYCANVAKCHFFVFTQADYVLLEIARDDDFL